MKRRLIQKRIRPLERMLSNACRLYLTWPGASKPNDSYESLARSIVEVQLSFLFWEQARVGMQGVRGYRVEEVTLEALEASANHVHGLGTLKLERILRGQTQGRAEPFRFRCLVPQRSKTYRGVPPPEVVLLGSSGTA